MRPTSRAPCYWNGSGTVFYRPGGSGSFDLTATVTDAQSGAQKANFPNVAGFGAGGDDTTIPFSKPYSYTGSPTEPGSQTITGYNNANASSTASVAITADSSAPTGISASVTSGYYTALSIAVTLDNGSDTGSGIDAATAASSSATKHRSTTATAAATPSPARGAQ